MLGILGIDVTGDYAFDASAKTITFSNITLEFKQIIKVINLTEEVTLFSNETYGKGGSFNANVLTLNYDTTFMNDDDELQIFIWNGTT